MTRPLHISIQTTYPGQFGGRLKILRQRLGVTQVELGQEAGISVRQLQRIENDE